jgi:hypothetical protein
MKIHRRLLKLEQAGRGAGCGTDDVAAHKRRLELMLGVSMTDRRKEELMRSLWLAEHGYFERWKKAEDLARGRPWREMNHDARASEMAERLRSGRDFLCTRPECPEILEGDLEELRRRYGHSAKKFS